MCGIAGILGRIDDANRAALSRMHDALAHRGPDAAGFWTGAPDADGRGAMLVHRRLSILDLSHAADQPMVDPAGGHAIVFNGEIYNYRSLREDLAAGGERFESSGDTAVLLRLLARQGPAALSKLRGMFAFALWDPAQRTLMLARDPLGIKPLYICRTADALVFASEVRAILASGLIEKPRLDPAAVASVVWNGFVMGPNTAVSGIETLWPGEYRTFDARGNPLAAESYWQPPGAQQCDGTETLESLARELRECVKMHLVSDVPLGIFLSGGIDSSAVANLAHKCGAGPINTFTLTFEEESYNEGEHARRIAEAIGATHHEILLTEDRFVASLERAIDSLDQPTFDGLNSWYMSQAVREAGLTVALVGTGGDEMFGGYKSFRELPALRAMNSRTSVIPQPARLLAARAISALVRGGAGQVRPQTRWAKLPDMIRAGSDLVQLYQLAYALFLPEFQRELLSDPLADGMSAAMRERLRREIAGRSPLAAISVLEQRCFLGQRLLRDTDAASMAVSLEVRLPLVDHVLLERVMRLPDDARYRPVGRKQALRTIGLAGLDPALFERPKRGFVLPFDQWIRKNLGQSMDQTMRDESMSAAVGLTGKAVARLWQAFKDGAPGMYWSRVWALYILIRWAHRHGVVG